MQKLLFTLLAILPMVVTAQVDSLENIKAIQARLHYGFIFAHSQAVQNTAGANPVGIEVDIIKQKIDTATWDICLCYPTKGWSISYFNYDTRILGHAITAAYFLEPAYRLGRNSQFRFRGSIGISYLTDPYHPQRNPTNMSYSTSFSGYLQLGISTVHQIASNWLMQVGVHYHHSSNGGLKEPNKGINWPTASLGLIHSRSAYALPVYQGRRQRDVSLEKPYVEAGLFFSAKQGNQQGGKTARTPLAGVVVQVQKQVGPISSVIGGVEAYYDNALVQRLKSDSIAGSGFRTGILAGHNFLLGRFQFSQQLGYYLYNRSPYFNRLYHRWTFRYNLNESWLIGFGIKAHKQVADFADIRISYKL